MVVTENEQFFGRLTSLLLDVDLAPEHEAHLKLIADAGRSLLASINDILDFSKVEAGKTKPIDRDRLRQIIATWAKRTDASPASNPRLR